MFSVDRQQGRNAVERLRLELLPLGRWMQEIISVYLVFYIYICACVIGHCRHGAAREATEVHIA